MKLIVFDLDGTLVNSLEDLAAANEYALAKFGFGGHNTEEYRYFVGNGVPELIRRSLPENERTDERIAEIKAVFDPYYRTHYADKTKPYDAISELLKRLKSSGFKLAVASNKPDEFTKKIVSTFFDGIFDLISGKTEHTERKPAPDIVLNLMSKLNVTQSDTIMVGDSDVDVFTAKNAGIKSIGCLWGFRTRKELISAGADFIVETPDDILKYI